MKFKIDSRSPVYIQVIRYFKKQIASGKLEIGEEIPSRRELAATLKINPNTVQRAYKEMEEAGLIFTDGNMPSKVTRDEQVIEDVREELVSEALHHFVTTLQTLQIPLNDILPQLEKSYAEVNGVMNHNKNTNQSVNEGTESNGNDREKDTTDLTGGK